jgi:hypothetical protein
MMAAKKASYASALLGEDDDAMSDSDRISDLESRVAALEAMISGEDDDEDDDEEM